MARADTVIVCSLPLAKNAMHSPTSIIASDFNVDFDRGSSLASLLCGFVSDRDSVVCDLSFRESVKFTYKRDDGLTHSWIDHIICSRPFSSVITDVYSLDCRTNLSDHLLLCFMLHINCSLILTLGLFIV